MGWQYRHRWWRDRLAGLNIRQSMSRKGNCIDNAATEQVFGHLKDEFHAGREFASYEQFRPIGTFVVLITVARPCGSRRVGLSFLSRGK